MHPIGCILVFANKEQGTAEQVTEGEGEGEHRVCRGNAPVLAPEQGTAEQGTEGEQGTGREQRVCRGNAPVLAPRGFWLIAYLRCTRSPLRFLSGFKQTRGGRWKR